MNNLAPGDYDVIEMVPNRWALLGVSCLAEGQEVPDPGLRTEIRDEQNRLIGATIHLAERQSLRCTYVNDRPNLALLDSVEAKADQGQVEIRWTTLTEPGSVGFNVMRSTSPTGPFVPVNNRLILTEGDSFTGATYAVIDSSIVDGVTYYYYIQELDINGIINHNNESWMIVSATPGNPSMDSGGTMIYYLPLIFK